MACKIKTIYGRDTGPVVTTRVLQFSASRRLNHPPTVGLQIEAGEVYTRAKCENAFADVPIEIAKKIRDQLTWAIDAAEKM